MNIRIGCDNGVSGALVAISEHDGRIISCLPMPIQKARKGNEIDVLTVKAWLTHTCGPVENVVSVTIEEPGGSKSAKAATSMAGSFHALRAVLTLWGVRWHRVTPQAWAKVMLPGCKAGDTKPRALELARRLWPDEKWLRTPRSRTCDNNLIDAALIAEYSRRAKL